MKRIITLSFVITTLVAGATFALQQGPQVNTLTEEFAGSGGVAVDADGFVYVADFGLLLSNANGNRVWKIDPSDGSMEVFATGFAGASGNDFDSQGNLIQSNIAGSRISRITPDGDVTTIATAIDGIQGPVGIAVDPDDNIFVANCGGASIARISADGSEKGIFVNHNLLSCPNGLTMDDDRNLYAANFNNGRIVKITPEGEVSALASIPGNGNGHLTFANGVLYVAARNANQIYELTLEGEFTLLAGTSARGNDDGNALESTMYVPNGVRVSPDGRTLYWNDAVSTNGPRLNPVLLRALDLEIEAEEESEEEQF